MSEIQPGDVVVRIGGITNGTSGAPPKGMPIRVGMVIQYSGDDFGLYFKAYPCGFRSIGKPHGWDARFFRKIRPADEQFIHLIRALRPVREDA